MRILKSLYLSRMVQKILRTDRANIRKFVKDGSSVLDIGCGPNPPVLEYVVPKRFVGVDAYAGSIERLTTNPKFLSIQEHSAVCMTIQSLDFRDREFDSVLMVDLIEHLTKEQGQELIERAKKWTSGILYISTPNGFLEQKPYDSNSFQEHLSGWSKDDFERMGFKWIRGGGGPKALRLNEMSPDQWGHADASSIRFKPKLFWSAIANLLQCVVYWFPNKSYQIYAVYRKQ